MTPNASSRSSIKSKRFSLLYISLPLIILAVIIHILYIFQEKEKTINDEDIQVSIDYCGTISLRPSDLKVSILTLRTKNLTGYNRDIFSQEFRNVLSYNKIQHIPGFMSTVYRLTNNNRYNRKFSKVRLDKIVSRFRFDRNSCNIIARSVLESSPGNHWGMMISSMSSFADLRGDNEKRMLYNAIVFNDESEVEFTVKNGYGIVGDRFTIIVDFISGIIIIVHDWDQVLN